VDFGSRCTTTSEERYELSMSIHTSDPTSEGRAQWTLGIESRGHPRVAFVTDLSEDTWRRSR
jgi:hypothetical protein